MTNTSTSFNKVLRLVLSTKAPLWKILLVPEIAMAVFEKTRRDCNNIDKDSSGEGNSDYYVMMVRGRDSEISVVLMLVRQLSLLGTLNSEPE